MDAAVDTGRAMPTTLLSEPEGKKRPALLVQVWVRIVCAENGHPGCLQPEDSSPPRLCLRRLANPASSILLQTSLLYPAAHHEPRPLISCIHSPACLFICIQ